MNELYKSTPKTIAIKKEQWISLQAEVIEKRTYESGLVRWYQKGMYKWYRLDNHTAQHWITTKLVLTKKEYNEARLNEGRIAIFRLYLIKAQRIGGFEFKWDYA